jgi:hypothetical protein
MVATDTVVGIIGAVLLVAVMGGVFAYEYNNPATSAGTGTMAQEKAHFLADYPSLNATDDLDGDHQPNYNDTDIDGDGVANEMDSDTAVHIDISGTVPMQASPNSAQVGSHAFTAGTGVVHAIGYVNYTATGQSPLPTQPALQVSLRDSSGQVVANGVATTTGSTVSIKVESQDVTPGQYTLVVSMTGLNAQARPYTGSLTLHYDAPAMGGHSHM